MRFRPCIDLHDGRVKQIVGGSLRDDAAPQTNFESVLPPAYYAELYQRDGLHGGHVIMLGPGNETAATEAVGAWPGGLQLGGGITADNAAQWLDRGAGGVIATSFVFCDGQLQRDNLERLVAAAGRDRLILDLSCAPADDGRYVVATERWQKLTDFAVSAANLEMLATCCCEFLIHATQMEGRQQGIDERLVSLLGDTTPLPTTYAGGVRSMGDVDHIEKAGQGRLDYTVGSALDLFGGSGVKYEDLVERHR
ncbi:MAG: phosphoribosylformimino-5-aminoimidazole carboxamide ribotide isomerase [Candidatus Latescibacteria bacterium]|jgi:phosphoribosylformimino-5-aminoimidazole carboxamide ribotide isomerase|nr:phosphoribosylformimino-5-aminoimidazole carboxamide ribotide isomerase [Candidatus Latescibacterota bacterium]MDP7449556.1 phosphoribosylformimino-5-aminoimidazole carboxamide ribotide isomerase [Candidatus Latescibacterota bacterium]HJP32088.1 phosphoribosylformimino-5-aminoimidazole carboxamide ribotide isomerase [Candidatus Latescibacterota bacterium]